MQETKLKIQSRGFGFGHQGDLASLVTQTVKSPRANAGNLGSIPGPGRSAGEGNGNPLQYSCLENSMDREGWRATVHEIAVGHK